MGGLEVAARDALHAPLHQETEEKFVLFCQEALGRLSLPGAVASFNERILALREERDEEAASNMSVSNPAPLLLHTRIVWNDDVHMEWQRQHECATSGGDAALDANDDGTLLCKFTRQSSGQHALLSASPQLARVLTRAFSLSQPFTIGSIDASSDMFRVCAAKLMLRNGYCVLASS